MQRRGFTVNQALGVVAGLWILAAIVYPIFAPASKNDGVRSTCPSQLKGIGLAFNQYVQDYDDRFPRAAIGVPFATGDRTWPDELAPYLKNQRVYICPQEPDPKTVSISYGYNRNLGSKVNSKLTAPALTVTNYEVTGSTFATCGNTTADVTASTRHREGSYFSFADGHVKWLKPGLISEEPTTSDRYTFSIR